MPQDKTSLPLLCSPSRNVFLCYLRLIFPYQDNQFEWSKYFLKIYNEATGWKKCKMEAKTSATCSMDYICLVDWSLGFHTKEACLIKLLELQPLLWIIKYTEQINNEASVLTCRQISRSCTGWYWTIPYGKTLKPPQHLQTVLYSPLPNICCTKNIQSRQNWRPSKSKGQG